jgi:hypothetical protein
VLDDGDPRRIEVMCGSGAPPPGDAVRLLDERDGDADRAGRLRHRRQIPRSHPSPGSVAEDQRGPGLVRGVQVCDRPPVLGLDVQLRIHHRASTA